METTGSAVGGDYGSTEQVAGAKAEAIQQKPHSRSGGTCGSYWDIYLACELEGEVQGRGRWEGYRPGTWVTDQTG